MQLDATYRLPAEFEDHSGVYLLWPHRNDNWRDDASHAQLDFIRLVNVLARHEPVRVGFQTTPAETLLRKFSRHVKAVELDYDDVWVRDTGPTIVVSPSGPPVAIDWKFNSWGGLFDESAADDAVARKIAELEGYGVVRAPIVLEGGAITTDGAGTFIATEESILTENRNAGLTQAEASSIFNKFLGAKKVIWLPRGLANDEAGGHVDNMCAFADARTLLIADTQDRDHPSYERVSEAKYILERAMDTSAQPFQLVPIPLPPPTAISIKEARGFANSTGTIKRSAGTPLAPSYLNLYVSNGAVVVPIFEEPTDDLALDIIKRVFPTRTVVPFQAREILLGGGTIHCVTRDIPRSVKPIGEML